MTWQTSYYHYDGLGSTLCLTDANGNVTDQYAYTAFGEAVDTGAANPTTNPFRYVGREGYYFDADSADYYVRARTYRPALARWLSEDPIAYDSHDKSPYEYVASRPTFATDPTGEFYWSSWTLVLCYCCPTVIGRGAIGYGKVECWGNTAQGVGWKTLTATLIAAGLFCCEEGCIAFLEAGEGPAGKVAGKKANKTCLERSFRKLVPDVTCSVD
jgi:RHS repeat-associated protein